MKLPEIWVKCESCEPECAGHPPEMVAWSVMRQQWLCSECWEDSDSVERAGPIAYAKDVLLSLPEQHRRMLAAAARRRMGAK